MATNLQYLGETAFSLTWTSRTIRQGTPPAHRTDLSLQSSRTTLVPICGWPQAPCWANKIRGEPHMRKLWRTENWKIAIMTAWLMIVFGWNLCQVALAARIYGRYFERQGNIFQLRSPRIHQQSIKSMNYTYSCGHLPIIYKWWNSWFFSMGLYIP